MNKKTLVILLGAVLFGLGCAGKVAEPTSPQAPGSEFVAPELEESEGIEGYEDVQLGPEDNQIIVPGANYGKAPGFKKKNKKAKLSDPSYWPKTEGVTDLMEGLEWGMTVKKVFSIFETKIREKYEAEMSANSGDLLAEDQIRAKMHKELNRVKGSYVAFDGQTTGYESHMVDVEFTHNNKESMLVWDAGTYVEYLFFINNRFWKRVRLFRIDKLGGISLGDFNGSMEGVLGCSGAEIVDDDGNLVKIAWRDADTFVAVLDGSKFFGVYGLRLSSAVTETYLGKLRQNKGRSSGAVDSSISSTIDKAVTSVDYDDRQESVVDQYTGKKHTGQLSNDPNSSDGGANSQKPQGQPAESAPQQNEPSSGDIDDLF